MQTLIMARHAAAEESIGSKPDPERALVDKGREQAALMGKLIAATIGVPGAIWCSPLRRAVETARLAMNAMALKTEPKIVADLGPGGDLEHLAWLIGTSGSDVVMLVGHQPDLGNFSARLLGLASDVPLKKAGMTILEIGDPTRPPGRAIATLDPRQYPDILAGREYAPWMRKQLRV